jgi:hypothetical protein
MKECDKANLRNICYQMKGFAKEMAVAKNAFASQCKLCRQIMISAHENLSRSSISTGEQFSGYGDIKGNN